MHRNIERVLSGIPAWMLKKQLSLENGVSARSPRNRFLRLKVSPWIYEQRLLSGTLL
jgi:hypothetical protein